MNCPKAEKDNQQYHRNLVQKHNKRSGTDMSKTISLDCSRQRQFHLNYYYLDQSSALYVQFLNIESRRKGLNRSKRFIFVNSDNTFHNTNFTTLNAALFS